MDTKGFEKKPWFPYFKNMYDETGGDMLEVDAKGYEEKPWWPYVLDLQEKIDAGGGNTELNAVIERTIESIKTDVNIVGDYAFYKCTNLTVCELTNATVIRSYAFNECGKLNKLVIRTPSVCALSYTNVLANTPFAYKRSGGTLYVPSELIKSYQVHGTWKLIIGDNRTSGNDNNQILPIEGSEFE